jgi:hypothetical protein
MKRTRRKNYLVSQIKGLVDFSKTVEENLRVLRENGIDMTEHTFHVKFKMDKPKEHERMRQEIFQLIDVDFTVLENQKKVREHGYTKYTSAGLINVMIRQKKDGFKEYDKTKNVKKR